MNDRIEELASKHWQAWWSNKQSKSVCQRMEDALRDLAAEKDAEIAEVRERLMDELYVEHTRTENLRSELLALQQVCEKQRKALDRVKQEFVSGLGPKEFWSRINDTLSLQPNLSLLDEVRKVLHGVIDREFSGIQCKDIDGKNWFDVRDQLLTKLGHE